MALSDCGRDEWLCRDPVEAHRSQWRRRQPLRASHAVYSGYTSACDACWCVGWMDETEGAERYRHAVIRPYIFAGRTIFLLKSGSSSRCFPLSDVAYLCGAPVKSETGRSRRFFSNDLIPFFLLFCFPLFFLLFHAFAIKELISVLWFNKYISFPSVYLVCVCLFYVSKFDLRAESVILSRAIGQVFHSEIVCPKDVPNFHL